MQEGKITVYYGEGYGKTSAAIGNAIKVASAGGSATMIQFLKGQLSADFFSRLEPEIKVFRFEQNIEGYDDLTSQDQEEEKKNYENALMFAKKVLTVDECDLLVLDEVLGIVERGLVPAEALVEVLSAKSPLASVIMTGDCLPEEIRQIADTVYDIVPEKLPG